jgi:hypothetical protein
MKTAVILSGLPRKVQEGYDTFWKSIITNHNADVYLHYWTEYEYEKVLQVYSPKKYVEMQPFKFTEYKEGIISENDDHSRPVEAYDVSGCFRTLPMFYGWQTAHRLLEGRYDRVIRGRYDLGWHEPLNLDTLDLSKINVAAMHWPGSPVPDDNLCVTNHENADALFSNIFNEFVNHSKQTGVIQFQERNFLEMLMYTDLYRKVYKASQLCFNLLRDTIVWY